MSLMVNVNESSVEMARKAVIQLFIDKHKDYPFSGGLTDQVRRTDPNLNLKNATNEMLEAIDLINESAKGWL